MRPGTFADRTAHERGRWAKWGDSRGANAPSGKVNSLPKKDSIPNKSWALTSFSSENKGNRRLARFAIDGDPRTIWHSQFAPTLAEPPHELAIDLGNKHSIRAIRYLARQDSGWNGSFGKCEVFASSGGMSFGESISTPTFKKTKLPQEAAFRPVNCSIKWAKLPSGGSAV
ncbi:MAG: discoidin domain-containing protein [Phycisphaerae bacterium]|nr:discoidin domain-containing protein [Phycisphaerae bacterium]